MSKTTWAEANAWWRQAARKMADIAATEADWEQAVRQLWILSRFFDEGRSLSFQDRQDLVQTVVEKLQDPAIVARVAEVDAPAHYLAEVMRNHLIDVGQRRAAAIKAIARHEQQRPPHDDLRPAAERAEERELLASVRYIVNHAVSKDDRTLLWGFYRDGKSLETLARELGLTTKAAAMRLSRARRYLKDLLKG